MALMRRLPRVLQGPQHLYSLVGGNAAVHLHNIDRLTRLRKKASRSRAAVLRHGFLILVVLYHFLS